MTDKEPLRDSEGLPVVTIHDEEDESEGRSLNQPAREALEEELRREQEEKKGDPA